MSSPPPPNQPPAQPGAFGPPPQVPPQQPGPYTQQPPAPGPYGYPQQPPAQPGPYAQQPPYAAAPTLYADNGWLPLGPAGTPRRVATMGQRFLARFIDGFIMTVIMGAIGGGGFYAAALLYQQNQDAANAAASYQEPSETGPMVITIGGFALALLAVVLYEWLMISFKGATWGKMMVGLRVMRLDNGQRPGAGSGFVRYLIPVIGSIAFSIGTLVVWLSPLFDGTGKRQGWHDKAAKTVVVDIKV